MGFLEIEVRIVLWIINAFKDEQLSNYVSILCGRQLCQSIQSTQRRRPRPDQAEMNNTVLGSKRF